MDQEQRARLLGSFEPDPKFVAAYGVYADYYHRTEMFDQLACHARSEKGHAIPIEPEERRACNANARAQMKAVARRLDDLEVPAEIRAKAQAAALHDHEGRRYSVEGVSPPQEP